MRWEGYITNVIISKNPWIQSNHEKTSEKKSIWDYSTIDLTSTQNCQGPKKQGKTEKLSQAEGHLDVMTKCDMDWTLEPMTDINGQTGDIIMKSVV